MNVQKLSKSDLLARFEAALTASESPFRRLSNIERPAEYRVYTARGAVDVKIYIRNITPGGNNRPVTERRIQPTATTNFSVAPHSKTIVIGWPEDEKVFAGWDVRRHSGPLGKSSSFQLDVSALVQANLDGLAIYRKSGGEAVIAFRPDFAGIYVAFCTELHTSGSLPKEIDILERVCHQEEMEERDIDAAVGASRRYAIKEVRRAIRFFSFALKVLKAYSHQCAMCSMQLD